MTHAGALKVTAQGEREIVYESLEARDAVLKSSMERGVAASYDRLEELLASTHKQQ